MGRTKEEILESGVVHFTLGEDFGILLATIAQEHIMYNYDIRKAIATIMEGLMGIELPMTLKIIKGDLVIVVDETGESVVVTERNKTHSKYPVFDIEKWITKKYDEIEYTGKKFKAALQYHGGKFMYREKIYIEIPVTQMKALFAGTLDGNDAIEYILSDEKINNLYQLLLVVKNYCQTSLKIHETVIGVLTLYGNELSESQKHRIGNVQRDALDMLAEVNRLLTRIADVDFDDIDNDTDENYAELKSYLESAQEIETVLSKGIEPVNIVDNYSAGWLAPDGTYYGLNGEIANMLHNQIADALQEKGIVPNEANEVGLKVNPDQWLEEHGWIKIHDNNVQFSGCNNYRTGKRNVDITDKQIEAIHNYIENCHACQIKLGWRLEKLSLGMFMMACQNKEQMYKKYFEF